MDKTREYSWDVFSHDEMEALFVLEIVKQPTPKILTSEEIWKMLGLEKYGTHAPSLTSVPSRQCVATTAGNTSVSLR